MDTISADPDFPRFLCEQGDKIIKHNNDLIRKIDKNETIEQDPGNICTYPTSRSSESEPSDSAEQFKHLIAQRSDAFELCGQGTGGTYFVIENGKKVAIFKPSDEEPGSTNNPKGSSTEQKPLIPPGGGSLREYAAYLLDKGFAGVPETFLVSNLAHEQWRNSDGSFVPKSGSVQKFVPNDGDVMEKGSSLFSEDSVHKIGILDIRLFNLDRNAENLLTAPLPGTEKRYRLVPIDHAYCLPPTLDVIPFFEWMFWRQAKTPFSPSIRAYIESINPDADEAVLRSLGLPAESIRTMRISTMLLKGGTSAGLTLFEMSAIMCNQLDNSGKTLLEEMVQKAEEAAGVRDGPYFFAHLEIVMESALMKHGEDRPLAVTA